MIEEYRKILEVEVNSSEEEIKRAYRKKALQIHPDVNPSPSAKEQFIKVTEAYEYLSGLQYVTIKENPFKRYWDMDRPPNNADEFKIWHEVFKEKVRRRAKSQAEKEFEEFKAECEAFQNSKYYFLGVAAFYIFGVIYILIAALMVLSPVIVAIKSQRINYVLASIPLCIGGIVMYRNAFDEQKFWSQYLRNRN